MCLFKHKFIYFIFVVAFSCVMSACATKAEVVFIDLETIDIGATKEPMSSIPYCCTSKTRKLACHGYNCGDSTRGCNKWCANN